MIEKILVPLDGSEAADKALDFALDLAQKYSAKIELLSVVPPVPMPSAAYTASEMSPISPVVMDKYLNELKAKHEKLLSEGVQKAKEKGDDLEVSTRLMEGRPSEKIVETAEDGSFDIVVMGSRGIGGVKKFLLGSVSDRVADEAPCPVLIVK